MKIRNPRSWGVISVLVGLFILLAVSSACSSGGNEAVDLLEDSKVGLAHINDELHTVKGEDLLASPTIGLVHLNEELHTIRQIVTDPKVGNVHLNDEFHTIKQLLADIAVQLEAIQR